MSSIDVRTRHYHDTVITQATIVETVSDRGSESDDEVLDLCISEYLIETSLFGIQDFSSQWKDRLELSSTTLFRRTTG